MKKENHPVTETWAYRVLVQEIVVRNAKNEIQKAVSDLLGMRSMVSKHKNELTAEELEHLTQFDVEEFISFCTQREKQQ